MGLRYLQPNKATKESDAHCVTGCEGKLHIHGDEKKAMLGDDIKGSGTKSCESSDRYSNPK